MRDVNRDPVHLIPRLLPRRWGRLGAPSWCAQAARPEAAIGEIWSAHPHNMTACGAHFGALVRNGPRAMLGELGRAPPRLRIIVTEEPADPIGADAPLSLWRILESPLDARCIITDAAGARELRCRRGDLLRVAGARNLSFGAGVTALEVQAAFSPHNGRAEETARKLLAARERDTRAAWLRDSAMSVEVWTLPAMSYLEPDGETCHVLMALTPGVAVDGAPLSRGDAVFIPAEGRSVTLTGGGAQLVAAYPDLVPTRIWKTPRPPKPAASALHLALQSAKHAAQVEVDHHRRAA